jgi:hypothetical protein
VAAALRRYADLGITHFVLSDTPYQREVARIGDRLLGLLRQSASDSAAATIASATGAGTLTSPGT